MSLEPTARWLPMTLESAWDTAQAGGLGNPNVVPFAGDLAEALARAGAAERAEEDLAWLQERAGATGLVYTRRRLRERGASSPRPVRSLVRQGPVGRPEPGNAV
jgi:hypothetical protein